MAIKYRSTYKDVEGIEHSFTIFSDSFVGSETEIKGSVVLSLAESSDLSKPVKGTGLTVNLDANINLTFSDLYSEQERTYGITYVRDSVTMFNGWLTSDGIYQDFVADKWIISIDCIDGLGFLPELSYVDSNGITFTGNQKLLDIISNCLDRTGIEQNINTNIDIYYTGLSTALDIIDNVYFNADRFVKDDNETIMSCQEVLDDVLLPFGAAITSFQGEWYIYKYNQLYSDDTPTFFRYDNDGVALAPTTKIVDFSLNLGSQIDGFYPHHINSNQSLRGVRSLGAYRISYKYGLVQSLLSNINLEHVMGVIDEWTINSNTNLTLNASGLGVDLDFDATPSVKNLTSDAISLTADDLINFTMRVKTTSLTKNTQIVFWGDFNYKIILTGGSTYYYNPFAVPAEWSLVDTTLQIFGGELDSVNSIFTSLPPIPINGDLTIEIYTPTQNTNEVGTFYLQEVSVAPADGTDDILKGEFHTFQREDNPSAKIKDTQRVNNGDNPSDIYYGTVYKTDGTTPTSTWFRKGVSESKPILRIMGEETMRLNALTSTEFSGDVYGYVPHISIVEIENVDTNFVITDYNYDTLNNVTNIRFKKIFGAELTDLNYELTFDYGNTVEPTIKG